MKKPTTYRGWHIAAVVSIAVLALLMFHFRPDLGKDTPTLVGSISAFITLYGTVVAIIELWRARSSVEESTREAKRVFTGLARTIEMERIAACQSAIKNAVTCIDSGTAIPTSTVFEILEAYTRVFYKELENPKSEHRTNKAHVESYKFVPRATKRNSNMNTTVAQTPPPTEFPHANARSALLAISGQFSVRQSMHTTFPEIST